MQQPEQTLGSGRVKARQQVLRCTFRPAPSRARRARPDRPCRGWPAPAPRSPGWAGNDVGGPGQAMGDAGGERAPQGAAAQVQAAADLVQQRREVLVHERARAARRAGPLVGTTRIPAALAAPSTASGSFGSTATSTAAVRPDGEERLAGRPPDHHAVGAQQRHPPRRRVAEHRRQREPVRVALPGQRGRGVRGGPPALRGRVEQVVEGDAGDQVGRRHPAVRIGHGQAGRDARRRAACRRACGHVAQRLPDRSQGVGGRNEAATGAITSRHSPRPPAPMRLRPPYYGKATLTTRTLSRGLRRDYPVSACQCICQERVLRGLPWRPQCSKTVPSRS